MNPSNCRRRAILRMFVPLMLLAAVAGCATAERRRPAAPSERQREAAEMFAERCKRAGEFIHKSVVGVEGIFLLKLRPNRINYDDQYALDDPYGSDLGGDAYIRSFLRGFPWSLPPGSARSPGYSYVEAINPEDGKRYRYTGEMKEVFRTPSTLLGDGTGPAVGRQEFVLERVPAAGAAPRYGVTFDDISTQEERAHWIAGSSLKVIDLQTNEVMAERIGYMVDYAQGSRAGGRSPWLLATRSACPPFGASRASIEQLGQTYRFVEKVLHPIQGQ